MKMKSISLLFVLAFVCGLVYTPAGIAADPVKVLFLTKSSGFEHSVVHREKGELGYAEKIMLDLAGDNGLFVVVTKDAGMINADQLKCFDVVMFYTTGDLTQPSKDNGTLMSEQGRQDLVDWVNAGGGFVGCHTASDTFHGWEPYLKLTGGEFLTHKNQEEAKMTVKKHPITSHLGASWILKDEYYMFKNVTGTFTPLLILETKEMKQDAYNQVDPYANTYIEEIGEGRAFNCALGHREDVWDAPEFQKLMVKGVKWAAKVDLEAGDSANTDDIFTKMRDMTREERREFIQGLSEEDRAKLRERFREQRSQRERQ